MKVTVCLSVVVLISCAIHRVFADLKKSSCCFSALIVRNVVVSAGRACAGGCPGQTGHQLAELREREAGHAGDVVGGARGRLWGRAKRVSAVRDGAVRALGRRRHTGGLRTPLRVPAGE